MRADRIEIRGLRVRGHHGVLDAERRDGQEFLIDAVLAVDTRLAAASDDLSLTVDYAALTERLAGIVAGEPVRLIETLAERLAGACLAEPGVRQAEITVHKPNAPIGRPFGDVAVTIRRTRRVRVVIGLGSNLGDRQQELQRAVDALAATPGLDITAISPVYETAPVGGPEQPDYLNAIVLAETSRPATGVLRRAHALRGRRPAGEGGALGAADTRRRHHRLRRPDQRRSRADAAASPRLGTRVRPGPVAGRRSRR